MINNSLDASRHAEGQFLKAAVINLSPQLQNGESQVCEEVKVLWKEASDHFDKLVHLDEQNHHYNGAEVITFHILQNNFYTKREQAVRPTGIPDLMRNMSNQTE